MPALRILFALVLIVFGLIFAWPLVRRWLPGEDWLMVLLTTFGLSLGLLSLWMLALSLLGVLTVWSASVLPVGAFVVGIVVSRKVESRRAPPMRRGGEPTAFQSLIAKLRSRPEVAPTIRRPLPTNYHLPPLVGAFFSLAVIAVNVLYYPFYYPDTLSRYGLFARLIFETGGLPEKVQGYPLLVSLGYALAFLAGGGVNDRLAGVISAAFCAAFVGVTYALGNEMYGRRAGLGAAFLTATSTLFVVWGTSGYVDIPTGFFFALSALFAWRWLAGTPGGVASGRRTDIWLAGISAGLAIWTKQAGWIIVPSLAGVLGLWLLLNGELQITNSEARLGTRHPPFATRNSQFPERVRVSLIAGLILAISILLVSGPWYLRNYLLSGPSGILPLPGSFYEAQADHRLIALFPFATRPEEWGWPFAILGGAGLVWGLVAAISNPARALRSLQSLITEHPRLTPNPYFLLAFILPYHLAWWWSFSYELRFLLTVMPFYAVLAGGLIDWILSKASWRAPWPATAVVCGAITLLGVWQRLGAAYHLVREPFATPHDIRLRLRPDQTSVVDYLLTRLSPETESILMMEGSYEYFLTRYTTGVFYPVTLAEAQMYDYLIYPSWAPAIYASLGHRESEFIQGIGDPAKFQEVYRVPLDEGTVVYRIIPAP